MLSSVRTLHGVCFYEVVDFKVSLAHSGLKVTCNFLVHLQSFASKIFFTSKLFPFVWETWMILTCKRLPVDIFFFHSQIIKISRILQVCNHEFRALQF